MNANIHCVVSLAFFLKFEVVWLIETEATVLQTMLSSACSVWYMRISTCTADNTVAHHNGERSPYNDTDDETNYSFRQAQTTIIWHLVSGDINM